jgi:hypothetical protein
MALNLRTSASESIHDGMFTVLRAANGLLENNRAGADADPAITAAVTTVKPP